MALPNPMCMFRSLWWSVRSLLMTGYRASGHRWVQAEVHHNCRVEVMRCESCGKVEILWAKED